MSLAPPDMSMLRRNDTIQKSVTAYKMGLLLNFVDRDVEQAFQHDIAQSQKRYVRLAAIVMMSIYIIFGFVDDLPLDGESNRGLLLALRYLVVVPTCAFFIILTFTALYDRIAQWSAFATVLIVGSIWLVFLADDAFDQAVYFLPPLIEVNLCALFFLGLLLRYSLLLCGIFAALYGHILSSLDYRDDILSGVIVSVVVINGLLILCAYQREMVTRTLFIKNREEQNVARRHAQDHQRDLQWFRGLAAFLRHEVRQPVALISSSLSVMQMKPNDTDAALHIANAETGVRHVWNLIDRATRATDAETFVRQSRSEVMDLSALTADTVEGFRQTYSGVSFRHDLENALTIHADPALVREAIANLLSNAASFADDSSTISIGLRQSGESAVLSVSNQGPLVDGDPEILFGPFRSTRFDEGQEHQGLGLYLVRLVAEHCGGIAKLANLPDGTGVEASINLPLALSGDRSPPAIDSRAPVPP
ncbi:MAG: sensor histidine kinase [Geminicoccales bacterium]